MSGYMLYLGLVSISPHGSNMLSLPVEPIDLEIVMVREKIRPAASRATLDFPVPEL